MFLTRSRRSGSSSEFSPEAKRQEGTEDKLQTTGWMNILKHRVGDAQDQLVDPTQQRPQQHQEGRQTHFTLGRRSGASAVYKQYKNGARAPLPRARHQLGVITSASTGFLLEPK